MKSKEELLFHLEEATGVLKSPSLKKAYLQIDRKDFVLPKYEDEAYEDHPLPIGYGQTISQPTTVFFMLELLSAKLGDHILDVGSGSGWTTALLGSIVGKKGGVVGVDIVSELVEYGRNNLKKYKKLKELVSKSSNIDAGKYLKEIIEKQLGLYLIEKLKNNKASQLEKKLVLNYIKELSKE